MLCCKPHKEQVILQQLQHRGLEAYFPYSIAHNGKTGKLEYRPYFPGYLFVKVDLEAVSLSTFQWMPHTEGLVCFETKPAYVPDHLLLAVRRHVEEDNMETIDQLREEVAASEKMGEVDNYSSDYDIILDLKLSSDERVSGLLHLLQGLSLPPSTSEV